MRTLAVVAMLATLTACTGAEKEAAPEPAPKATEPETMTVSGALTLIDGRIRVSSGGGCYGTGGYDDMRVGAQVTVRDADGKTVGLGSVTDATSSMEAMCRLAFQVEDVPTGGGIYSVEVSHRGEIQFKEEGAGSVELSLSSP